MSLISNRKRPRGFSESNYNNQNESSSSNSSESSYNDNSLKMNYNTNNSDTTISTNDSNVPKTFKSKKSISLNNDYLLENQNTVFEETDESTEENMNESDDLIVLEERNINNYRVRPKRNNSDSILFLDDDSFNAFNLLNVNNNMNDLIHNKKQRTNSLPQLPQVKCSYNKIPNNYISNQQKLGNVKTSVVPFSSDSPPCVDKDGHYIIELNSTFANRFVITKILGQGTFGKVVECYDKLNRENVAVKIIRNIPKYRDAAKIELRILSTIKKFDNENLNHCLHLRECFDYRGHICIVTDLLRISLYDFLEQNRFIPFPGSHIQAFSRQLIRSVAFLHDLNLIHTDLKPENILLYDDSYYKKNLMSKTLISSYLNLSNMNDYSKAPKYSKVLKNPSIQIIDFGSAIFNDEYHSSIVSTRHYRAPEIVLGIGWSFPCDMWSVGCILVELIIGEPLFKTHDNLEHLAMIERFVGSKMDKHLVKKSKKSENECGLKYFTDEYMEIDQDDGGSDIIVNDELTRDNSLSLIFPSSSTPAQFVNNVNQLSRIDLFLSSKIGLKINFDYSLNYNYNLNKHLINFGNFTFWWFFIDLLKNLFILDPANRFTAQDAMNHPWFNLGIEDEGTVA